MHSHPCRGTLLLLSPLVLLPSPERVFFMLSNHPAVTSLWQPLLTVTPLWVQRRLSPQCLLWRAFLRENTHYPAITPNLIDWRSQTFRSERWHRRLWRSSFFFCIWKIEDGVCVWLHMVKLFLQKCMVPWASFIILNIVFNHQHTDKNRHKSLIVFCSWKIWIMENIFSIVYVALLLRAILLALPHIWDCWCLSYVSNWGSSV